MNGTNDYPLSGIYQKLLLRPLGLDSDNSLVFWLLLVYGTIIIGGLWYFNGDLPVVLSLCYVVTIAILSFVRVDFSLYTLVFLVLLFDQFGVPGFEPLTYHIDFFRNLKEISYLPEFEAGVFNIIEVHFLFIILSLLTTIAVDRDFAPRPIPVPRPFLFFVVIFIFSFLLGLRRGGDFLIALWEVRAFFYFFICYLIVPQIIRSRSQLQILIWVFIVAIAVKAFQGIARYISNGFTTGGFATLTNHEDPVFMVTLFILLFGFFVYKVRHKQYFWLVVLLIPMLLGFYFALRRASYASFMVAFVAFIIFLPSGTRWKFMKVMLPCLVVVSIYTVTFWNSDARFTRPIQMVKSGFERPTLEENERDYYSNLYREIENYNLAQTVVNHPVIGTGFGRKYDQPLSLVDIRFPLRDYIPHNEIIWVIVKMGAIGFTAFWFFFNSFVAKGVKVFSKQTDPYLKAVTAFIVVAIINQMVVSYFDLQLTYYRNMIYLGCITGLLTPVEYFGKQSENKPTK